MGPPGREGRTERERGGNGKEREKGRGGRCLPRLKQNPGYSPGSTGNAVNYNSLSSRTE